jgi:acyl carrier protein
VTREEETSLVAPELDEVLSRLLGEAWSPALAEGDPTLASLGVDSVRMVELVLELEVAYGVAIPDELLVAENFATVGSVGTMMRKLSP